VWLYVRWSLIADIFAYRDAVKHSVLVSVVLGDKGRNLVGSATLSVMKLIKDRLNGMHANFPYRYLALIMNG
jgi:hypothetical protein